MVTCCSSGFLARRSLISLCLATALGAAAFVGGGTEAGKAPRALDPALLFPAGSVLMLSFDGKPMEEFGKELAISKIWHEPEVQEFFKEPVAMLEEQMKTNVAGFTKQLGIEEKDLEALGKSRIAIAVTRFAMPEGGMGAPEAFDLMLAADLRGSQKTAEVLIKALEDMMGGGGEESPFKASTVGGIPAKTMPVPGGMFDGVTWLFHDGWLIAGTNTAQLEGALARAKSGDPAGSLAADPLFAAGMKEVTRPKTVGAFYMDYGTFMNIANAVAIAASPSPRPVSPRRRKCSRRPASMR